MLDKLTGPRPDGRPVLAGVVALVGVGLVIGLVLGGVAWLGSRTLGLDVRADSSSADPSGGDSLFLPRPRETRGPTDPLITLAPEPSGSASAKQQAEEKQPPISLSLGALQVPAMQEIDLTGVYPGGEGAILQIQRFEGGAWADFPATISVSDETFSTYVLTGQTGVNRFRVADTETSAVSNEVKVTVT